MKHYKYSRKEWLDKWWSLTGQMREDLLATISKEEYSQRIMMEQVPKQVAGNYIGELKQDKPVVDTISLCKSCNCMTKTIRHFCGKCGQTKGYLVGGIPQIIKQPKYELPFYKETMERLNFLIKHTFPKESKETIENKKLLIKHGYPLEQVNNMDILQLTELALKQDKPECEHEWELVGSGKLCMKCHLFKSTSKPETVCEHKSVYTGSYGYKFCNKCGEPISKQPVCEHKYSFKMNGRYNKSNYCIRCGEPKSPPIEDTNKTRLEVPELIRDMNLIGTNTENIVILADKIDEILDYLTLISLDKK